MLLYSQTIIFVILLIIGAMTFWYFTMVPQYYYIDHAGYKGGAIVLSGYFSWLLLINMIKTSELTGDLPETLDDMADYYASIEKTKKQIVNAMTYPTIVFVFAIAVIVFIMLN